MLKSTLVVGAPLPCFLSDRTSFVQATVQHDRPSVTLQGRKLFGMSSITQGRRNRVTKVQGYNNSGSPGVPERVVGALPYLLPLFDGLRYGKFLFVQFPVFANVIAPLNPLIQLYFSVPFAGLAAFFAVYILIINNYEWPRNVRFNAMQAILLDIILILPGLIESVLKIRPMGGIGLQLYIQLYNAIFLFIFAAVVYGIVSSMIGQTARIPLVADAADAQIR